MTEPKRDETWDDAAEGRKSPAEISAQNERLREAIRRQDRYLRVLLHDLRNPIAAISMAAEALSQFAARSPDIRSMSDVIARQSRLASRMLDELLEMSRVANGKLELRKERMDLVSCVRAAVGARQTDLDKSRAVVRLELPAGPIWIDADPGRITQALGKLIDGAVRLAGGREQIEIKLRAAKDPHRALVELDEMSAAIAAETLATVFEPFDTDLSARQGIIAIDLPLAQRLIELHGGTITAASGEPGIRFRMTLPLANVAAEEAPPVGATAAHRSLRILLIDDNADVATSLEFLLKASGHVLSVACTGKQGIEKARQARPDVVLCDIGLPDMEGYAVARQLRASPDTAGVYLIAVSGYAGDEDQRRSLAAGFDLHLNKPEGLVGLNERLQSLPVERI